MDMTGPCVCSSSSPLPDCVVLPAYSILRFLNFSTTTQVSSSPAAGPLLSPSCSSSPSHFVSFPNFHMVEGMEPQFLPAIAQQSQYKQSLNAEPECSPTSPTGTSRNISFQGSMESSAKSDQTVAVTKADQRIRKARVRRTTISSAAVLSPDIKKSRSDPSVSVTISVKQTETETVVHTDSVNFRDVVHQLTGASTQDQQLLPITIPARHINRNFGNKQEAFAKVESGGTRPLRGSRSIKLHERRRTMKKLGKLNTNYKELPPLVPSPVTPLSADFERFWLPITHTASPGRIISVSPSDASNGVVQQDGMTMEHQILAEELATVNKGFYLHSKKPRKGDLILLNLFPEFPDSSPSGN